MNLEKFVESKLENGYFNNLDGLRFISALGVLAFHNYNNFEWRFFNSYELPYRLCSFISRNGLKAVNFFFVLSGFLITFLICKEIGRKGKFEYKKFVIRRALRIWPLFFVVVIAGFLLLRIWDRIYLYLLFANNVDAVFHQEYLNAYLFPLWSIAVEEQFYLIIPLIIYIFSVRTLNGFLKLFIGLLIISIFYQVLNRDESNKLHYATLSCLTDVCLGSIAAILSYFSINFKKFISNLKRNHIIIIYIIGTLYIFLLVYIQNHWLQSLERLFLALFFCFIILEQNYASNSLFKMSKSSFLSESGKYTYSLYLTHMFVFTFVHAIFIKYAIIDNLFIDLIFKFILSVVLSYYLSYLLYKYFEYPILKYKSMWK